MSTLLQLTCKESLDVLDRLSQVCHSQYQCAPMSPAYIQEAKGIIILRGTKAGLGVGLRRGHGILLSRLPSRSSTGTAFEPPLWSAPVFLKVTIAQLGFIFGFEQLDTFMLAMTRKLHDQLLAGGHTVLGVDQSAVMFRPEIEDKSDLIATAGGDVDLAGISNSSGAMLDFSLSGGSLSVDHAKMAKAYGSGVGMAEVIGGAVPSPVEVQPLYERLNELVKGAKTESIARITGSLERMTAGYDPDRHDAGRPSPDHETAMAGAAGIGSQPLSTSKPMHAAGPRLHGADDGAGMATHQVPSASPSAGAPAGPSGQAEAVHATLMA
ncbi:hypothetical protein D9Q98_007313 [Chlorella vulgaris]|uniref:Ysc84 actin-binding domain-containing protein n=1 Tax=Chlorella vulgaris TaxID=3077 RepID=A0A9D4YVH1_CHLVU|nr:hypothetical protein D9Q98_007313 [Chlorella vulgaris]